MIKDRIFGKTYNLSLTAGYVISWGIKEAVREILQNALDSEFPMRWDYHSPTETLSITNDGTYLEPKTLLLGSSDKTSDKTKRGSFGEGYKLALLVLLREGKLPRIYNGNFLWKPQFAFDKDFNEEILQIVQEEIASNNTQLSFVINNISQEEWEDIRTIMLDYDSDDIGRVVKTSYGNILLDKCGELYVGSLFVCKTTLAYSYDVKPEHIKLERDRQTVDGFELKWLTKEIWLEHNDYDFMARLMEKQTVDLEYIQYSAPPLLREACYRLFKTMHPESEIAVKSQKELEEYVERGMTKTVFIGGSSYYSAVTTSKSYLENSKNFTIPSKPHELLIEWFDKYKKYMRRHAIVSFKKIIDQSKEWKNK